MAYLVAEDRVVAPRAATRENLPRVTTKMGEVRRACHVSPQGRHCTHLASVQGHPPMHDVEESGSHLRW